MAHVQLKFLYGFCGLARLRQRQPKIVTGIYRGSIRTKRRLERTNRTDGVPSFSEPRTQRILLGIQDNTEIAEAQAQGYLTVQDDASEEETLRAAGVDLASVNALQRLEALRSYHILDSAAEQLYDDITALVGHICKVPMATISLVDESRQWFKSRLGITEQETPRDVSFCAHAIMHTEPLIVHDATKDSRFLDSLLVTQEPHVRFYAGFPLVTEEGLSLGALCGR